MVKLYVSDKTLNNLSNSKEFQDYAKLFNRFDIEQLKPRQPSTTKQKPKYTQKPTRLNQNQKAPTTTHSIKATPIQKNNTIINSNTIPDVNNNLDQDAIIRNALQTMKESLAETRHNYIYSPQKAKELSQMLKNKKRKQQITKLQKSHKPTKQLRPKVIKLKKNQRTSKRSSSPIVKTTDYNDLAGEYESRQVEFGHGRTKSKEWNDEIARKFQKEMKGYHKKRDWTDRFAIK